MKTHGSYQSGKKQDEGRRRRNVVWFARGIFIQLAKSHKKSHRAVRIPNDLLE